MTRETPTRPGKWARWLKILLRIDGAVLSLAFLAVFLPTPWMEQTSVALGLEPLPDVALTQYLTRSLSLLYGVHGVLFLLAASDPRRLAPLVETMAILDVVLSVALTGIDLKAGMPLLWTLSEAFGPAVNGLLLLFLLARARRDWDLEGGGE